VFELWFTDILRMFFSYGLQTYLECCYNCGYKHIKTVFEYWFTDILRVF